MAKSIGIALVVVAVVAAAFIVVRRRTEPSPPADSIVLITIDTLRADRVGRGLTPAIDALAANGARFTNARAVVPLTLPSHVTMMTGVLPARHGVRQNGTVFGGDVPTLARQLRDAGYQTAAFVGAYVLDRRFGLNDGFTVYDDRVPRNPDLGAQLEAERPGAAVADAALAWLATAREPFFAWIHFYDPHAPYAPPPEFLAKAGGNPYDGEVGYVDAQVGRVLEALTKRAVDRRTVVAITGDHGEGLGDHGEQTHGMLAYDSTLRVPLVIAGAGVASGTLDTPVSLVDLPATLLSLANVNATAAVRRRSILSREHRETEIYGETDYPRTAGWRPITALADGNWKLIVSAEPELYDLRGDAGETTNVASSKPSLVEAMSKRLRELSTPAADARRSNGMDPEAAERLRALGYVSGSSAAVSSTAPNPVRVIADWNTFEDALTKVNAGDARAVLPLLRNLATKYPTSPVFQTTYGRALKDAGEIRAALAVYRDAVRRAPADASLFHDLAVAARGAGERNEALKAEQAALALDSHYAAAHNGIGLLHAEAGRAGDAATSFERAVETDPTNAAYWTNLGNARRELEDVSRAETAYRHALDLDPRYADALNGLGVLLVQRDSPSEAIPLFERALQSSPEFHQARLNLGIALQESNQPQKAAAMYRQLLATAPPQFKRERQAAAELLKQVDRR